MYLYIFYYIFEQDSVSTLFLYNQWFHVVLLLNLSFCWQKRQMVTYVHN